MQLYLKLTGSFMVAFMVVFLTTPWVRKWAIQLNVVDKPNPRRINKIPIPGMGGLAIVAGFWVAALLFADHSSELFGLAIGASMITLLGVFDDIKNLSPWFKLVIQFVAAFIIVIYGFKIEWVRNPFGSGYLFLNNWAIPLTMLWIVGVTNAVNFIDGLDGLAAGTAGIASLTLLVVALGQQSTGIVILMAALAGSCAAFLKYNFNPAKIFMGDTGALSLGFLLAAISVNGLMKSATTIALVVPVLALALPIGDTAVSIARRLASGKSPFYADKGHLHHRLLDRGHSHKQAVGILYALNIFFGVLAIFVARMPREGILLVFSLGSLSVFTAAYLLFKRSSLSERSAQNTEL